jgi:outer membrane protein assembly factor BamB
VIRRRLAVILFLASSIPVLVLATPALPSAVMTVQMGWPEYRFDAAGTAFNPFENLISPTNVGTLTLRWRAELGEYAAPNPIVVDGVVYAVSHFGTGYGLDAATGQVVWRVNLGSLTNGDAPAINDGMFYAGTLNGDVVAIDLATRQELWRTNVGGAIRHAMNLSGGLVYVNGDDTNLEALDAATGALVWSAPAVVPNNTPALGNGLLYVGDDLLTIWALDPATGAQVWKKRVFCSCYLDSQVVVGDGVVAVGIDTTAQVRDAANGSLLWTGNVDRYARSPALAGGVLYVTSQSEHGQYGPTRAFDVTTGAELWETDLPNAIVVEIAVANAVVYLSGDDRHVYALDASTGTQLWRSPLTRTYGHGAPVVADGMLYVSDSSGVLYAFGLP